MVFDADIQASKEYSYPLKQMIAFFNDETDVGKLYINYPMFESYKDHDNYNLTKYLVRNEKANDVNGERYKRATAQRGYQKTLEQYDKIDFINICVLNIYKALQKLNLPSPINYEGYRECLTQEKILDYQLAMIEKQKIIDTLHTSVWLFIDYYGEPLYYQMMNNSTVIK